MTRCNWGRQAAGFIWLPALLLGLLTRAPAVADEPNWRQQLEQLTAAEKEELLRKKSRFDELPPVEQERLRRLHAELEQDPQCGQLQEVLARYGHWLKSLSPGEKAELMTLPLEARLARIKKLLDEQEAQRFRQMVDGRLGPADQQIIMQWLEEYVGRRESDLLEALPEDRYAWLRANYDPQQHRRMLIGTLFRRSIQESLLPSVEDEQQLIGRLSRSAQDFLAKLPDDADRTTAVKAWIRAAAFSKMRPPADMEELKKFVYENLDTRQREYLESLPRERMLRELQRLYFFYRMRNNDAHGSRPPPWPPGFPPPGPPPGAPRDEAPRPTGPPR